jgi:2-amino-4-hydroxy-6-hydroxymethyldihydropteridine diphosphokinase
MALVYLGIGSNLQPKTNFRLALRELSNRFSVLQVSPVYRNQPVGFEGADFLNAVVCVETDLCPQKVCQELEDIHDIAGRARGGTRLQSRTLDIDLLLYDDLVIDEKPVSVPRSDILDYAFVLRPLVDIAPDLKHPQSGRTLSQHWDDIDAAAHPLHKEPGIF